MQLEADLPKLTELAQSLDMAARNIEDELSVLTQASRRFTAGWRGQAEHSYQQHYAYFATKARVQVDVLRDATASLRNLIDEYVATDRRSAKGLPGRPLSRSVHKSPHPPTLPII